MNTLYFDTFFKQQKELLQLFEIFDQKHKFGLIKKLRQTKDKIEFLAIVSEINFGIFLSAFTDDFIPSKDVFPGSKLTPDWVLFAETQKVIVEVFRINAGNEDQKQSDFEEDLSEVLKDIQIPVLLSFSYTSAVIDNWWNLKSSVVASIRRWLSVKPSEGEAININELSFTIIKYHKSASYVLLLGGFHLAKQDIRRLTGDAGRFMSKVNKYGDLCIQHKMPFIICIYMHPESWLHPDELSDSLYGPTSEYHASFELNGMYPGTTFRIIEQALYYANSTIKQSVSGVLLRYMDKYSFYPNYSKDNQLNKKTFNKLLQIRDLHTENCPLQF